jgi:hypothetical protein
MHAVTIPSPISDAGPPFTIGETLTVYQAAMVYADRHPHEAFLAGPMTPQEAIKEHEIFLGRNRSGSDLWRGEPREQESARRRALSWDIYQELLRAIEAREIAPVKAAYCGERIDPTRTMIATSALLGLAQRRGDAGSYLKSMMIESSAPVAGTALSSDTKQAPIDAERRCQAWLEERMKAGAPMKAKRDYCFEAKQQPFGAGVSERAFLRAWANAITSSGNEDWRRPGRKAKRKS